MLNRGDTFLTGDEEDSDLHLWIVLTPPTEGEVVTVSVTTRRQKSELLVQLRAGDHPFIRHESVVSYRYARIRTVDEIETALLRKLCISIASGSAALQRRKKPPNSSALAAEAMGCETCSETP